MKFLIDRCAGRRVAEWLRHVGHDVREALEREPDPGDAALLAWAVAEQRVLVTLDKDFAQLVFVENAAHCGIVRLPDVPPRQRVELLRGVLAQVPETEIATMVVAVSDNRIRLSATPTRRR